MIEIPGYSILNKVYDRDKTLVLRANRESDKKSVILKLLRKELATPEDVSKLQNEYRLVSLCSDGKMPAVYGLNDCRHGMYICMEDYKAESLDTFMPFSKTGISEKLRLSLSVCGRLQQVHVDIEDLDYTRFDASGGRGRMWQLFGENMETILNELNEALAA